MLDVLNLSVHVEEDDYGNRKYVGIDARIPDNFSIPEFIGYLQMASMDLANKNSNIQEFHEVES